MHLPESIAKAFTETFDGSAIELFRRYLSDHPAVHKWMIAADFSLRDPERPLDCMAFSILPYDDWPHKIKADVDSSLPKDIKKTKDLSPEAAAWLSDGRRFHIAVTINRDRTIFNTVPGSNSQSVAREHIHLTIRALDVHDHAGPLARFIMLRQKAQAKSFNVKLLGNIWLLGVFFAVLTIILGREHECSKVGWFPDRDNMTNFCEGIWSDYAFWNTRAFCDAFDVDLTKTQIIVGAPDRSGTFENMWFDYMIRSADWFAGSVAAWDRSNNLVPGDSPKYRKVVEEVLAGAKNVVLLHGDIDNTAVQFRRIVVERAESS